MNNGIHYLVKFKLKVIKFWEINLTHNYKKINK